MLPEKNTKVLMGMLMAVIVGGSLDLSIEKNSCKDHHRLSNIKNNHNKCNVVEKNSEDKFNINTQAIYSVAISPNPLYIFIIGNNKKITRLNVKTRKQIELPILGNVQGVFESIAVSIDGGTIASGGRDYDEIYIRKFSDQQQFKSLPQSDVTSLIFSQNGQSLVSGSENGEI